MTSTISVNGVTVRITKGNVEVSGRGVYVDGQEIKIGKDRDVHIKDNVNNINCKGSVTVEGNVKGSVDAGGSVTCNDIGNSVDSGGSVKARKVGGNIDGYMHFLGCLL